MRCLSCQNKILTGCRQHLFPSKDSIRPSHETHRLLELIKSLPTRGKPDDGRRKHNPCRRDRAKQSMVLHRLLMVTRSGQYRPEFETCVSQHTSFFSNGVPGIGTRAFTGKDSGCSGMLVMISQMSARA